MYQAQAAQEIIQVEAMLHFIIALGAILILIRVATAAALEVVARPEIVSVQQAHRVRQLSRHHSLVDIIIGTGYKLAFDHLYNSFFFQIFF